MALLIIFMTLYFLKFRDYLELEENARNSDDSIKDLLNENKLLKARNFFAKQKDMIVEMQMIHLLESL